MQSLGGRAFWAQETVSIELEKNLTVQRIAEASVAELQKTSSKRRWGGRQGQSNVGLLDWSRVCVLFQPLQEAIQLEGFQLVSGWSYIFKGSFLLLGGGWAIWRPE